MEDCPILLAKIHEKGAQPQQPSQNLQMMRAEPREEYPKVNNVLQSGAMTSEDKAKHPKEGEWVHKAPEKETGFDIECVRA